MRSTVLLMLTIFSFNQLIGQGIDFFQGSWEEAIELAKANDKVIFVDAYTTWCGPCKKCQNTFLPTVTWAIFTTNFSSI